MIETIEKSEDRWSEWRWPRIRGRWRDFCSETRFIPANIRNIVQWFPVLWNNWDFDYAYLLIIVEFKLRLMEKHFREHGHTVDAPKVADELKMARCLVKRIEDEEWLTQFGNAHKRDDNPAHAKYVHNRAKMQQKQDVELLCKLLRRKLLCWWD